MTYETLLVEVKDSIATVKVNRPKALNALNGVVLQDLINLAADLEQNTEVGAVILTGEGDKAFVAGADIASMQAMNALDAKRFCALGQRAMRAIETLSKPVIAAVNGFCLGGG
ncbi:MAG: enoyl-CoA hydratase/isomerase family protein, partial [Deltaproteobacteria bacterium]|nr:enoyl-CoA hydratase/isomerase family protein [Deltaproteobacteria bacterium]